MIMPSSRSGRPRTPRGTGLANYEVDASKDDDEDGNKLQRRHSERQSGATPREKRRNSAPGNGLKIPRFLSREKSDVSEKNNNHGSNEWKTCNNLKLSRGSDSGRVKVFVRIRPFRHEDMAKGAILPFTYTKEDAQISWLSDDKSTEKTITFDHLFTQEESNQQVCNTLTGPLIHSAMNGFNGTLMAYGQTCSGKTYTLMSDSGITQSLVKRCFSRIQGASKHNFKVTVSYLQIYQEKIFDLLKEGSENVELAIRENPHSGIYVENLTEYVVRSPHEVQTYIAKGQQSLMFSETKMNQCSSRSHAVLQITIERTKNEKTDKLLAASIENDIDEDNEENEEVVPKDKISKYLDSFGKDVIIRGKIHICDLAGSERIKRAGDNRLQETQAINSSLLELGNVIQALADDKATHVPYRNSMLTRLLQESLGGNCKTGLIICISPSSQDFQETKCSLNFGQRASKVRNKAYINMEVDYKKLSEHLMKEIDIKEHEIRNLNTMKDVSGKTEGLQKRFEEMKRESQVQKEMHTKELEELQEEIFVLNEQVYTHKEQIAECENSSHATTQALTTLKKGHMDLIKTENVIGTFFDRISISGVREQFSLLKSFYQLLLISPEKIEEEVSSAKSFSEYFDLLRTKTESIQVDDDCEEANVQLLNEMKAALGQMRNQVHVGSMEDARSDSLEEEEEEEEEEEDKTSDSGRGSDSDEEKLSNIEVNVAHYKVVLRSFINFTTNSLEMLHVRLKSEMFEDETRKLSTDFQNYKSTKDLLFTELARARQEERDFLANENLGLQSKVMGLEATIKEMEEEREHWLKQEEEDRTREIKKLEEDKKEISAQFQNYKVTTELSLTQMEKQRRAEKDELSKEMNEEISRLQRENNGALSRIREYTTTIKEQESEIINCNNIMRKMEHDLKTMAHSYERDHDTRFGGQKETQQNEMVSMEAEIQSLNMRIKEMKQNEMEKDDEILKLQLESINRICDSTNIDTLSRQTEIHILTYKIQSMESDIHKLQTNVNRHQKQLLQKKDEVLHLREEHRDLLNHARESMYSRESEASVKELSEQIAIADIEVTDLHTKIDVLERAVEVKKMELSQLQRDHNNACAKGGDSSSTLPHYEDEINTLKSSLAKLQSENDQLRCEIKMFERKAADKENDLVKIRKVHSEELAQMRESAASLSRESEMSLSNRIDEIRDLTAALRQMESKYEEMVYTLKTCDRKEMEMKSEITRLIAERDDSVAHFHRSMSSSKDVERELEEQKSKVAIIEVEKKDLEKKLSMQREREEETEKEITKLRGNCSDAERHAQQATSKLREKEGKMGDLSNLIKELQEENVELFQKISEYEQSNEDKNSDILRLREECENNAVLEEKKEEIASLNSTVLRLKSENETLLSKLKYLEEREEDKRVEIRNLQQERSDSVKQVLECASTARERENEIKSMNTKLTQVEIENEELRSRVKSHEKKREENKKKVCQLQEDQEGFENEVKELREQVAKLEAENEDLRGRVTICERKEEEKKLTLCNNKPKSIETTTRIGHTIYTARYHENNENAAKHCPTATTTTTLNDQNSEISEMNLKLTELQMENHELKSKIKISQEIIEEDKKNEIQQNDKILQVQTAHHSLMNELEMCKSLMEEKENVLKKVNPELEEMRHEKNDLLVKLEAYKQIIKQKETKMKEMENKLHDLGKNEYTYSSKLNKRNNETLALQSANEKLLAQIQSHKAAVEMHKKSNEEAHEEVTKLTLENSNLMSQFECFLTAINKKEKLCKKLVAKVCDLEVINEKLFQSISQSVNENSENGDDQFNKACTEKMKELLANALVEQEERLVAEITTETENSMQRSERISINPNHPKRELSDKSLLSSVYNTLKSAEKAQMDIKEKLSLAENETTELHNKCGYLETSVMKLQKEKKEYLSIILELTHSSREGKNQNVYIGDNRCEKNKVDNYSQTDDLSAPQHNKTKHGGSKGKHALKVAHIKPLVNNENDKDVDVVMESREAHDRTKEHIGRDDFSPSRNPYSSYGSPVHRNDLGGSAQIARHQESTNNPRERRRQEITRYSSICSNKDNTKRNSEDSALGSSSPIHSSGCSDHWQLDGQTSIQDKSESDRLQEEDGQALVPFSNTNVRTHHYENNNHDNITQKPPETYHVTKYVNRYYNRPREANNTDEDNEHIRETCPLPISRPPPSLVSDADIDDHPAHDYSGYHESKEKTIEVCSAYLSSKCTDGGKENKNLKLKRATNLTNSKRYHTIGGVDSSTSNDVSKLVHFSDTNEHISNNNNISYVSKYSSAPRIGSQADKDAFKSNNKVANRYGLDIDLSEEGSPASPYPYSTHYNSIIHKYDRFALHSAKR